MIILELTGNKDGTTTIENDCAPGAKTFEKLGWGMKFGR